MVGPAETHFMVESRESSISAPNTNYEWILDKPIAQCPINGPLPLCFSWQQLSVTLRRTGLNVRVLSLPETVVNIQYINVYKAVCHPRIAVPYDLCMSVDREVSTSDAPFYWMRDRN